MKIAIIGTGNVGGTLAKKWGKVGHTLLLGMRDPNSTEAQALTKSIGLHASAHTPREAASQAEVILIALPWNSTREVIETLGDLSGKILIDCTNPLKKNLEGLEVGLNHSGGELVQEWATGAKVYKAFNTVGFNIMENPVLEGRRALMFFCGNDNTSREVVRRLIEEVGFEALDVGDLCTSRLLEPWALLWIRSAYIHGLGREFAFGILKRAYSS